MARVRLVGCTISKGPIHTSSIKNKDVVHTGVDIRTTAARGMAQSAELSLLTERARVRIPTVLNNTVQL